MPPERPESPHHWTTSLGKAAGIIVDQGDCRTGRPPKFASAHDLRRSCADRMQAAGVPQHIIQRIMRHATWQTTQRHYAPGNIQREAGQLRELLGVPDVEPVPYCFNSAE